MTDVPVVDGARCAAATPPPALPIAADHDLTCCRTCHTTVALARGPRVGICPVCGARVRARLTASLQRSWALLLTAVICYVPANLYPIMTVTRFGRGQPDTIASGIVHLVESGQWPIALIVLLASIVVPGFKIGVLVLLLVSVQGRWRWRLRQRARLFRFIDVIGRWSMIDVFMISILVALVHLGTVATVTPGIGAAFFAVVVLATMLATAAFDERLLWDAADGRI
ncbi:MAG: paraquat-inducible protein A [Gammaproteobacteria bacterium]